jgi:MoxR-like ATPase
MIAPSPDNAALLAVERVTARLNDAGAEALGAIEDRLAACETRARLIALFDLSPVEIDALDTAIAVAVEPALGARIGALQGMPHAPLPTAVAVRLLFGHGAGPLPRSSSPLLAWRLVSLRDSRVGEPPMIEADPAIVEWYYGLPSLAGIEGLTIVKTAIKPPLSGWDIASFTAPIREALERRTPLRVLVVGPDHSGRTTLAATLAEALGHRGLSVAPFAAETDPSAVARVERLALLMGKVAPIWRRDPVHWPPAAALSPLRFVTVAAEEDIARIEGMLDLRIVVPMLDAAGRAELAERLLPAKVASTLSPLAGPRVGDLADAAALGIASPEAFAELMRTRVVERVKGVGQIVAPRYGWNDLVLPAPVKDLVRAIETEARARDAVLEKREARRLFEGTAALTALFAGPPGTGKSMCGQVVAGALKLDLLVVDSSAIGSKWIGDQAKNLTRVFALAREANCAIMFEEADGWFARRVENDSVNARYANADTGHLLQLIEAHRNLVMLSTNRKSSIDAAFMRRLRFIVDFPLPGLVERTDLWMRMLGALGVTKKTATELAPMLAEAHGLSAAQIKAAALSAAFQAKAQGRKIESDHVLIGIRRELAKEGRVGDIVTPIAGGRRAHG